MIISTNTPSETVAISTLGNVLKNFITCEIIKAPVNLAAMPKDDFLAITTKSLRALNKPLDSHNELSLSRVIYSSYELKVQLDFYGAAAFGNALIVITALRNEMGFSLFEGAGNNVQTLYASDAQKLPIVTDEQQYLERWMIEAVLQINSTIAFLEDTAIVTAINLTEIDTTYAP